mmetsp:Transcript_22788/g.65687  ORF Transcript_22788/g.65687 Transcript_22788/m.65687 type:complete len:80 (-) Transcript_22788:23-262(-)
MCSFPTTARLRNSAVQLGLVVEVQHALHVERSHSFFKMTGRESPHGVCSLLGGRRSAANEVLSLKARHAKDGRLKLLAI